MHTREPGSNVREIYLWADCVKEGLIVEMLTVGGVSVCLLRSSPGTLTVFGDAVWLPYGSTGPKDMVMANACEQAVSSISFGVLMIEKLN